MPVLANAKHEKVAQLAAKGIDGTHAYMTVYPNSSEDSARSSAATLLANPSVRARVQELSEKGAACTILTKELVINGLLELAQGDETPHSVRRAAWRDLGEHLAMFKLVVNHDRVESLAEEFGLDPAEIAAEAEAIIRASR